MRFARHPVVHSLPPFLFLVIVLSFRALLQQPSRSALLPAAAVCVVIAIILYRDAKARLLYSHFHRDMTEDTEQIYFNSRFSPIEKMMVMEQRTGCGTVLVALGYLVIALLLAGLWLFARYHQT